MPFFEARKIRINALDVGGDRPAVAPRHGADLEVLLDRLTRKRAAPLRHVRNTKPHDVLGGATVDRLSLEADLARGPAHAGERTQGRGLAGAVRAEQGGNAAVLDREPKC